MRHSPLGPDAGIDRRRRGDLFLGRGRGFRSLLELEIDAERLPLGEDDDFSCGQIAFGGDFDLVRARVDGPLHAERGVQERACCR